MNKCLFCGKESPKYHNYCSWECQIAEAKEAGGEEILPNGLPVGCIRWDGAMLECEHGDHSQYKYPVPVDHDYGDPIGVMTGLHALLFEDGNVALTLYEARYWLFDLRNGKCLNANASDIVITEAGMKEIERRRLMLKTIPLAFGTLKPYHHKRTPTRSGQHFKAFYATEPTQEDVLAFSASLGFGDVNKKQGGYIIGEVKIKERQYSADSSGWVAEWEAIPD